MNRGEGGEKVIEKINEIIKYTIRIHEETAKSFAVHSYILEGIYILGFTITEIRDLLIN